jgi:hypothetical protein
VIQRRAVVGIVFAITASLLTACGFESPDVEASEHPSVQGADFSVGAIKLDDAAISSVTNADGSPAFYLSVTIVNDGTTSDTLTGATTAGGTVTVSGPDTTAGHIAVPPGVPVEIGAPTAGTATPSTGTGLNQPAMVVATTTPPQVGGFVPVVFTFATAGSSGTISVPVIPAGETTAAAQPVPSATASVPSEVGPSADD